MNNDLNQLIATLSKLPGLGPRSARRVALHLIKNKNKIFEPLIQSMNEVYNNVQHCQVCNNLDTTSICSICLDNSRNKHQICVVEEIGDLWAIEKGGFFDGLFHVLGGTLSAIDGVGPDQLAIAPLLNRLENGEIEEVILANNATVEGKTTAHYLIERMKKYNVKISRLAYGIPVGGEIDYLDELTLSAALSSRQTVMSE